MRILYLAQRVPYPPDRGDKITTYREIAHLARDHEVSVACLADGPEDLKNVAGLTPLVASVDVVPLRRTPARLRALAALASGMPLTVAYFNERDLHTRVAARMASHRFDAVIAFSSGMAQFVEPYAGVPRIMQFADLDSLKWRQYADNFHPPRRWVYATEARRLLRYERHIATTFSHSLLSTPRELEDFEQLIPGAAASCVSNGVDLDYFRPLEAAKTKGSLVFTGVMDYFPNVQGVIWFCHEVLPLVRARVPDATLTICGARPNAAVQALERLPGVKITGRVADVRPHLACAEVGVVPLHIARGIQNKLLEAMALGLPTVTTTPAFEGVGALPETHLLVADRPVDFAAAIVRLLRDEQLRARLGKAARTYTETNYRWETQLARLDEVLAAVTAKASRPRQAVQV
ncbi:MAG TPA: TIGR03087 family PEP-CTERM/XrtA system glycosyltransferase [Gemmataceae bacterium]|jgi:sugar transferase (PEP-CTERM/EpsH1 system associated)